MSGIVDRLRKRQGQYMGMAMDADIKDAADAIEACLEALRALVGEKEYDGTMFGERIAMARAAIAKVQS